jgi:hypothetical protein
MHPIAHDLRRLAVAAVCSDRTARRWYQGPDTVRENSRVRLERAAAELGLPLPSSKSPEPSPTSSNRAA